MNSEIRIKSYIHEVSIFDENVVVYDKNEVDEIVYVKTILGRLSYLVKWKNWSLDFYTWEHNEAFTAEFIDDCLEKGIPELNEDLNVIHLMLNRQIITKLFDQFRTVTGLPLPIQFEDIPELLNAVDASSESSKALHKKHLKSCFSILSLDFFRQLQYMELREWEIYIYINEIQTGTVKVENNIDLEGPPKSFVYLSFSYPEIETEDTLLGCDCREDCLSSINCCNKSSDHPAVFDANKKIIVSPDCPIFECNTKCKCSSSCINRVVQLGCNVNVCIYKSKFLGWGLKTYEKIDKGQFIGLYVGEIITRAEASQRSNRLSSNIMWKLDFNGSNDYKYVLDNKRYANYTRFINHSCEANLNIYFVWINCLDKNLPQLALFANRNIFAGEKLTMDYFSRTKQYNSVKMSGTKCQCETKSCKGYYF